MNNEYYIVKRKSKDSFIYKSESGWVTGLREAEEHKFASQAFAKADELNKDSDVKHSAHRVKIIEEEITMNVIVPPIKR